MSNILLDDYLLKNEWVQYQVTGEGYFLYKKLNSKTNILFTKDSALKLTLEKLLN